MKQIFTLILFVFSLGAHAQTVFVKQGATGLNNGTSWANAYTSLDAALSIGATGQSIWVAAGTYKPSLPAPNNSFTLFSGVNLYGGFAGNETAITQRNIAANPTIFSGDILGDDITGNFDQNRADNSQHVLIVVELNSGTSSEIDGCTIRGGQTLVGSTNGDLTRRGGGIIINAKASLRNCTFSDNFGESGAALAAIEALSDGILIENCLFQGNKAAEDGVCFLRSTPTGLIKNCIFRNNNTKRGALYPSNSTDMRIDGCLFESNTGVNFGAGMFTWQATFTLTNSIFRKNKSVNAAGMYIDGRDGDDLATIKNCLFENDTVTDFGGGGIYAWQATMNIKNTIFRDNYAPNAAGMYCDGREFDSSFNIDSCTFEGNIATSYGCSSIWNAKTNFTISNSTFKNNVAPSSGPALYNSELTTFAVNNCVFEGNKANYAGAVANYGLGCIGEYNGCTFVNNQANQGGGAASNGFKANVTYKNCDFLANLASFGGAIFTQNDTTELHVEGCYFKENNTTGTGGCIIVNNNIPTQIKTSTFYQNIGATGGAISANGDSLITIDKCSFLENIATTQGAAINFNHVNSVVTNCLFAKNINTGTGAGGGISSNASDDELSQVKAVNCTFADNIAAIGAGIAQWESEFGNSKLTLLNCLLQNPDGENYSIEEGNPEVFSLNGNQSNDQSLELYLMGSKDLHNTFNNFQDPDANNYAHTIGSPASDGGVTEGAAFDDILGIPRYGIPDVGYREVKVSGTHAAPFAVQSLQCTPNPAAVSTVVTLQNERIGQVQISIWNQSGQLAARYSAEKTSNAFSYTLPVQSLVAGTYNVQVRLGAMVHQGVFVKR
jgi:hypothetical protein